MTLYVWEIEFISSIDPFVVTILTVPNPPTVRVCGRSLSGVAGSNPTRRHGYLSVVSVVCCAGRGLCYGCVSVVSVVCCEVEVCAMDVCLL